MGSYLHNRVLFGLLDLLYSKFYGANTFSEIEVAPSSTAYVTIFQNPWRTHAKGSAIRADRLIVGALRRMDLLFKDGIGYQKWKATIRRWMKQVVNVKHFWNISEEESRVFSDTDIEPDDQVCSGLNHDLNLTWEDSLTQSSDSGHSTLASCTSLIEGVHCICCGRVMKVPMFSIASG